MDGFVKFHTGLDHAHEYTSHEIFCNLGIKDMTTMERLK